MSSLFSLSSRRFRFPPSPKSIADSRSPFYLTHRTPGTNLEPLRKGTLSPSPHLFAWSRRAQQTDLSSSLSFSSVLAGEHPSRRTSQALPRRRIGDQSSQGGTWSSSSLCLSLPHLSVPFRARALSVKSSVLTALVRFWTGRGAASREVGRA